jgi:cyanate permease
LLVVSREQPYGWVILFLLFLLYLVFGAVSRSIHPLVTPILEDLQLSNSQMGLILGSWQLVYIPAALVAGRLLDRWGVRRSIVAGALLIGLSAGLRYFANGFGVMLAAVALFGAGGPMISIGGPKAISEWFEGRGRGIAMGIYTTGPSVGGFLALSLTHSFLMPLVDGSWRMAFVCYGLMTFSAAFLWWILARDGGVPSSERTLELEGVFRSLLRLRTVRILLVMALLSFAVGHGLSSWLPRILELSGLTASAAGLAAALPVATSIPAVLLIPALVPRRQRGAAIALCALVTSMTLFAVTEGSGALLYAGLSLLGISSAPLMPLMLLILMDTPEVGPQYMGSAGGMFFCVAEIGGFSGPFVMGILVDTTGTFFSGTLFLSSLCLAMVVLALLLRTPHRRS